jgi:iron complex transport system substrate-binding protein
VRATPAADGGTITVTDMVGRTVELDAPATNVFGAGPPGTSLLYTFSPDLMAGWNTPPDGEFLEEASTELPVLGRVQGGQGDFNPEGLLEADVDLIIDAGDLDESYIESADDLQELTGIPVVMLSTDPEDLPEAYELIGQLTGEEERADEIGEDVQRIVDDVAEGAESIPEDERVSIYYGMGADPLSTAGPGSIHSRVIEAIGAENAADLDTGASGRQDVDAEQILSWDPDWLVVSPDTPEDQIVTDPTAHAQLGGLEAIQDGQILYAPSEPFGWFDGPPSVNQLLGMMWTAESVYPEHYDFDLEQEVVDFYADFYHVEISADEARELLVEANTPGVDG